MIARATPTNEVESWLRSGKPASIGGQCLRPLEHGRLAGTPLSVQCGQAQAYFLRSKDGETFVLKKFLPGRSPDSNYLLKIKNVVPDHDGLRCGTDRILLTAGLLQKRFGYYRSASMDEWLEGTVLMPRVLGESWASVADDLRAGDIVLDAQQRMVLVRSLAELIQTLEASDCAHRDLSSGNVFVDGQAGRVSLIDFDGVWHPSLTMPDATAAGTEGYLAPFVWNGGQPQNSKTWCPRADRFALALLCIEFLVMDKGSPLSADGGLFDQADLERKRGKTIAYANDRLKSICPSARKLLQSTLQSNDFDRCPSPSDWLSLCANSASAIPSLTDVKGWIKDDLDQLLRRASSASNVRAPSLSELPIVDLRLPGKP